MDVLFCLEWLQQSDRHSLSLNSEICTYILSGSKTALKTVLLMYNSVFSKSNSTANSAWKKVQNIFYNNGEDNENDIANNNLKRENPNELPEPQCILYPRENVRIGWKGLPRKWYVGVGMMNVGNTCYLNSTLQAIFHVPSMANWLFSDTQHMEKCENPENCIICAMAKTLQASQSSQSAIRPHHIYTKLKLICRHLVLGRQEDAHEFLRYLVEAMEKCYLSRYRHLKDLDQYSKETTPLNQILGGYLKTAVQCLSCNHVSVTFQHFQDLLLDIRKADTIEEALDGYFLRERLEDMGYKCESCKKKVSATKQFVLERAPIALCIQLKRFSVMGTKINKQITIKPRLDLSKYIARKNSNEHLTYRLVAMVTHLGASQHCGHYTAIGLTDTGTYYNYDDSYVRPVSIQNVCNTNAYIIFYEMDNTPPREVTSTQVSASAVQSNGNGGFTSAKETYQKLNGYSSQPMQRMIGPQLPVGGLNNYTTTPVTSITTKTTSSNNDGMLSTMLYSNGNKLSINKKNPLPTSNNANNNSKIMIHFKNSNNNNNTTAVKSSACSSVTTATATSSSQNGSHQYLNNNNTHFHQNGLLTGTGTFQESAHKKFALASTSNKGQGTAISNGNEISCSTDYADEVSSSTQMLRNKNSSDVCTSTNGVNNNRGVGMRVALPSMPNLCDTSALGAAQAYGSSNGNAGKRFSNALSTTFGKGSLKSLVPYEFETDDDDASTESRRLKCSSTATEKTIHNPLKRHGSLSSECETENTEDFYVDGSKGNSNAASVVKMKRSNTGIAKNSNYSTFNGNGNSHYTSSSLLQSKAKQKTDVINDIFSSQPKRNVNTNSNKNNVNVNGIETLFTSLKRNKSQNAVSSTTPAADSDDDGNIEYHNSDARPPFKRSHSTPPSPPVIKSKTGLWQVTTLKPFTENTNAESQKTAKNPKNPFATKTPDRPKLNGDKSEKRSLTFAGNGYQCDTGDDTAVSELLKHSHRGYGASVLTWNGDQPDIEKEIKDETRTQRQRDWEEEEENEMDRGRQKKVKAHKETHNNNQSNRTGAYNPFQMEQENQRRWRHGGGNRFHGGHFRNQFQRNKFKFHRFNHKYHQRAHNNGSNNNNNNSSYNRRDS